MQTREKDAKLAADCQQMSSAAIEAREWADENAELLGSQHEEIVRLLQKQAVEARKLARAAARPMSVGIFGPSQHGKSFLSGGFLKPRDPEKAKEFGQVRFGNGAEAVTLDFTTEVNPQGGRETTGFVTRFTLGEVENPLGFPVKIRIMSEVEIVKILANSFVFDLNCDAVNRIDHASVAALFDQLEAGIGEFTDNFRAEDIFELEDYFRKAFRNRRHPVEADIGSYFWQRAGQIAPRLPAAERVKLLSLLWGGIEEFSSIYLELKAALDELGNPETAFVALDAITNLRHGETILHVLTMKEGLEEKVGAPTTVVSPTGQQASIRRPVVAALSLEMTVRLEKAPWNFFETTDLLDFPGCRKREDKNRETFLYANKSEKHPVGEAFLRGKVAVMFDSYADDFDINYLIACHKCEQPETNFPELVQEWVNRTHGASPEERAGKPVCLFFGMTWSDLLLDVSAGADVAQSFDNKLNVLERMSGFDDWADGHPFDNAFLLRSPDGRPLREYFEIEDLPSSELGGDRWLELRLRDEKKGQKASYEDIFSASSKGSKHFADSNVKWDSMLTPNDGGIRMLASSLEDTADPDIKYGQISPRRDAVRSTLTSALGVYFESGDIAQRIRERLAFISEAVEVLDARKDLVPRFISEFQMGTDLLRRSYVEFRQRDRGGSMSDGIGGESFGEVVMEIWARRMSRRYSDEGLCRAYGLESRLVQRVGEEIERGARLASIVEVIDAQVGEIENYSQDSGKNADRVGVTISLLTGEYVSHLGCRGTLLLPSLPANPLFEPRASFDAAGLPIFTERREDMVPERYRLMADWLQALLFMTEVNASSTEGSLINVEQNARLGDILARLEASH